MIKLGSLEDCGLITLAMSEKRGSIWFQGDPDPSKESDERADELLSRMTAALGFVISEFSLRLYCGGRAVPPTSEMQRLSYRQGTQGGRELKR